MHNLDEKNVQQLLIKYDPLLRVFDENQQADEYKQEALDICRQAWVYGGRIKREDLVMIIDTVLSKAADEHNDDSYSDYFMEAEQIVDEIAL